MKSACTGLKFVIRYKDSYALDWGIFTNSHVFHPFVESAALMNEMAKSRAKIVMILIITI